MSRRRAPRLLYIYIYICVYIYISLRGRQRSSRPGAAAGPPATAFVCHTACPASSAAARRRTTT
eukprot:5785082-Heterocapsa_arctica.AAC.1